MSLFTLVRRHPRLSLLLSLTVVVLASLALGHRKMEAATPVTSNRATLSVTVTRPKPQQWPVTLSANGNITAWQEAIVGAEIGGLRLTDASQARNEVSERGTVDEQPDDEGNKLPEVEVRRDDDHAQKIDADTAVRLNEGANR